MIFQRLATDDLQLSFEKAFLSKSLVQVLADNGVVKPTELELEIILAFSQGRDDRATDHIKTTGCMVSALAYSEPKVI